MSFFIKRSNKKLKKYLKDNGINFSSKGDSIEIKDIFFHHPPPKGATTVSDMINVFYSSPGEKQQLIQDFKKAKVVQFREVKDVMIKFGSDRFLKDLEIKKIKEKNKTEPIPPNFSHATQWNDIASTIFTKSSSRKFKHLFELGIDVLYPIMIKSIIIN